MAGTTKQSEVSTFAGIAAAFFLVCSAIYLSGDAGFGNFLGFIDIKSIFIVIGGTFFLTTASFNVSEVWSSHKVIFKTIFYDSEDPKESAILSLELAEIARKKGILGLEKYEEIMEHNPFFKKGMMLIIDGVSYSDAEKILNNEIISTLDRHSKCSAILRKAAEISPAMGLIGTLIGLVQMLGNLEEPSLIGPSMAIALLTTLYGATLAFMVFIPLASKLERNAIIEAMVMKTYLKTIVSIGKRENPRRLEMLINASLPPSKRVNYFS